MTGSLSELAKALEPMRQAGQSSEELVRAWNLIQRAGPSVSDLAIALTKKSAGEPNGNPAP